MILLNYDYLLNEFNLVYRLREWYFLVLIFKLYVYVLLFGINVYMVSGYNLIVLLGIGIILFFIVRCVLIKY